MSVQAPVPERVTLPGPAGPLEAVIEEPSAHAAEFPDRYAVLCHPHPLFGGSLTNKVVHTLARTFQELGVPTLRFNFRGVGASAGAHDAGRGEVEDALAAIEFGSERWAARRLWLAGFSFGAFVAARAAGIADAERLVLVAPPIGRFDFSGVSAPRCPWLVVQGDADELVEAAGVRTWADTLVPAPTLVILPGVDHFFHGRLHDLKAAVLGALRGGAGNAPPPG